MQRLGERIKDSQLVKVKRVYLHTDIWEICFKITSVTLNSATEITYIKKARNSNE